MDIQCRCGQFRARLTGFPRHTPGRLVCYCDDCQAYLRHLGCADLLDPNGGTEVIPVYPSEVQITAGLAQLGCVRLSPTGTFRYYARCCRTPVMNTRPKTPWAGFLRGVYTAAPGGGAIDQTLGPVRSRIMGRYARGTPPAGTPAGFNLKAVASVLPFMLKGLLLGKGRRSPFFQADGVTPVVAPEVLDAQQREALKRAA